MAKRKIIHIDGQKCNGCGLCIPNCPEGAIQMIDGKARLISDLVCDGLGACLGHCPQGAITIEEREAKEYDERLVMENIVKQGPNVITAHLEHLREHGQTEYLAQAQAFLKERAIAAPQASRSPADQAHAHGGGCPGARMMDFRAKSAVPSVPTTGSSAQPSELRQWPVQLMLVPPMAPYLANADLLIAADCVPFAYASFHQELLKGKMLLVACPKLDDLTVYRQKLQSIVETNNLRSITYAHMEVPCCFGLIGLIKEAISASGKEVPFTEAVISISGEKRS